MTSVKELYRGVSNVFGTGAVQVPRLGIALTVICISLGMATLDLTVVNIAVPSIRDSLHASDATTSWIAAGFSLVMALTLIPAGRIGDRYGHLLVFMIGLGLFAVGSLWTGLSPDELQITIARIVQGLGAGMIFPSGGALIQLMFEGKARARALGVLGAVIGASAAVGGILAGVVIWLAGPDLGWRWLFFINIPIAVACAIVAWFVVPRHERHKHVGFDGFGLLLITVALLAILVPVIEARGAGWPWWWIPVLIIAGLLIVVAFAFWERRVDRRGRTPLIPPALFKHWSFAGGITVAFCFFAAFTSLFFGLSIYWQGELGKSALDMALTAMPFAVGAVVGSVLSSRIGPLGMPLGAALSALGITTIWVILVVAGQDVNGLMLIVPIVVAGFGNGVFVAPNIQFVIATVPAPVAGGANGLLTTMQRFGAAIGVAIVAAVIFSIDGPGGMLVCAGLAFTAFFISMGLRRKTIAAAKLDTSAP